MDGQLATVAAPLRAGPPGHAPELLSVVAVQIGSQEFALDVMSVQEIRSWSPPTPLPLAPSYVQGMSDLRGVVIPIIDLAARLELKTAPATATSVIVVTQIRDRLVGLLVDGVSDLIDVTADRLQAAPEIGATAAHDVIRGVIEVDGRLLTLLVLEGIIPANLPDLAALS